MDYALVFSILETQKGMLHLKIKKKYIYNFTCGNGVHCEAQSLCSMHVVGISILSTLKVEHLDSQTPQCL